LRPWKELLATDAYGRLENLGSQLETGMTKAARVANVPVQFNRCGSMFCAYFTSQPVHNLADAMKSDSFTFRQVFPWNVAERGVLGPFAIRSWVHIDCSHSGDIEKTVSAAGEILKTL
jgi:glutamate-1-semialdehyde 2,1-aminomutase